MTQIYKHFNALIGFISYICMSVYLEEFLTPPSTPPSEEEADGDWSQPVDSDALEASLRSGRDNYDR